MSRPGVLGFGRMGGALLAVPMLLCSACDDRDELVILQPPPTVPTPAAVAESPADADTSGDGVAGPTPPGVAQEDGVATGSTPQTDRLAREVADILAARCASCHDQVRADGGLGDLHDFARGIEQGVIVPGAGAQSPLVLRMADGSMPPTTNGKPSRGEIALVTRFIDRLPVAPAPSCGALSFRSLDEVYTALLADVQQAPVQERPFLRYTGLTYASNAGWCGPALARQRSALFKLVNSVSTAPDIRVPRAIDSDGTLYRVDVRDYNWNREIDPEDGGADFADGWLALATRAGPYAVELVGPEADALKRETTTAVPFLPANALVHAASSGSLYYALVGVRSSPEDTRLALGVDLRSYPDLPKQAGFSVADPRRRESRVLRTEQRELPGRSYWVMDEEHLGIGESIYESPLDIRGETRRVIFNLPNGMQAYEMEDRFGLRADVLEPSCSTGNCGPLDTRKPETTADCHACHEAGLVPVTDSVRKFVEDNQSIFDRETFDAVLRTYLPVPEFDQLIQRDSQLHLDAVARAGVASDGPEPISFVHFQFELDRLPLRRVAAELGVSQEQLTSQLDLLDPGFAALSAPDGGLERAALSNNYAASLCLLHASSRNRPAACP